MEKRKKNKNRNSQGKFVEGNKAAVKWTETTVAEIMQKMWATLTAGHEDENGNFVRANDIKTLAEICLMHDVSKQRWSEWKRDFAKVESVSELIKKIEWVIETRLVYSGQTMDIFVLKNHYNYRDKSETDITSGGESIRSGPILSDDQFTTLLNTINGASGS